MEFLYTVDPNADEPIMLIDSNIGADENGVGIMGDKFSKELMFLDTLGKNKIHIWINSPGGVVTDGEQIFGTILKTKTKVDTHNLGIAASIAFPIFLAGRNRYMMDYAKGMMHPVSGGDDKTRAALEDSVVTMLSSRSLVSPELIKQMMAKTTWLTAQDCANMGLCEIEKSGQFNKPKAVSLKEYANKFINNKNSIKMNKVTNKLGLNDAANEDSILAAIVELENRIGNSNDKFTNAKKQLEEAEAKFLDLQNKYNEMCTKAENEARIAAEAEAKAKVANAAELITNAVKAGKITNDAKVIEAWTSQAVNNLEGTKSLIDSIPVNKSGANLSNIITSTNEAELTNVIASTMNEVRNNLKLN